ncbi:MAG TPA: hypothetical protein VN456_00845 [Desulfosporosinus sp.]|nr:hypothetical protein [Desulfosporosinus sp.]
MADAGFVKVYRDIKDHWIYKDPDHFKAWFEILSNARYIEEPKTDTYEMIIYTLNYGEFIFSRSSWSKRLGISEQTLYGLVATDHDFAQLINTNIKEVARYRKYHEKLGRVNNSFFSDLIFVHKVETELKQPLFEVMFHMYWRELDRNEKFRIRIKDKADESFPALKHMPRYVLHKDAHGNQVAEPVYQPLELV